jgi:hypothetical protein
VERHPHHCCQPPLYRYLFWCSVCSRGGHCFQRACSQTPGFDVPPAPTMGACGSPCMPARCRLHTSTPHARVLESTSPLRKRRSKIALGSPHLSPHCSSVILPSPHLPAHPSSTHDTSRAWSTAFSTPQCARVPRHLPCALVPVLACSASVTGVRGYCHTRGALPLICAWNTPTTPSPSLDDKRIHSFLCSLVHHPRAALGCNLQDLQPYKHWRYYNTATVGNDTDALSLLTVHGSHQHVLASAPVFSRSPCCVLASCYMGRVSCSLTFCEPSPHHARVAALATLHALARRTRCTTPVDTKRAIVHLTSNRFEQVRIWCMHATACSAPSGLSTHQDASCCCWT